MNISYSKIEGPPEPPGPPQPHEIDCECDESIYFVPHPNSCEHYFICARGESFLIDCAPGFYFDPVNNWCDFSEKVECAANTTTNEFEKKPESMHVMPIILTPLF